MMSCVAVLQSSMRCKRLLTTSYTLCISIRVPLMFTLVKHSYYLVGSLPKICLSTNIHQLQYHQSVMPWPSTPGPRTWFNQAKPQRNSTPTAGPRFRCFHGNVHVLPLRPSIVAKPATGEPASQGSLSCAGEGQN